MDDRLTALIDSIPERLATADAPSVALAVARGGEVICEAGFGWADEARGQPAACDIPYPAGSLTKPITATALMVLVERGLVELDRPINDYLGDPTIRARVGRAEDATVRRVASHTAGLPLHYNFFYGDEPGRRPDEDGSIRRYGHLVSPPGERFVYSNMGYALLGRVIERASGTSFREFVQAEVLGPLGMSHSAVGQPAASSAPIAALYDPDGRALPAVDSDHPAASSAWSSALDLLRFGMFHLGPEAFPEALSAPPLGAGTVLSMQAAEADERHGHGYGIGWRTLDRGGISGVYHDGRMDGAAARLMLVPARQIAVVALTNSSNWMCPELCDEVLDVMLPGLPREWPRHQWRPASKKRCWGARNRKRFAGRWDGVVDTGTGQRRMELAIGRRGRISCRIGDQEPVGVDEASARGERLTGVMDGDLGTEETGGRPYRLHLDLTLRAGRLCGTLTAISRPGSRLGSALSHWCVLDRTA